MLQDLYTSHTPTEKPWQSYPRPQMRRESYVNLNGKWEFRVSPHSAIPEIFDREILVPFCPESLLSGLKMEIQPGSYLFYRRTFTLPEGFQRGKVLLHFGAVDQIADIYVNQKHLCHHEGGYNSFTVDITPALLRENQLVVRVLDDLRSPVLPYGKQTLSRGGMWYTPVSGIWQTVWLESVPDSYVQKLDIRATERAVRISIQPPLEGAVILEGKQYPLREGAVTITPENPRLWSPEDPYLYTFTLKTEQDRVDSYFALRSITVKNVKGIPRLCLNGSPYFFNGVLDQGYWSDGLYTPAEESFFDRDILQMKQLGFNTLRKHIKVEPEQFYYACDRLGMVVFQDMVNNSRYSLLRDTLLPGVGFQRRDDRKFHRDPKSRAAFLWGMEQTVEQLKNHPCILYWTIFNEGWGQFCSDDAYVRLKKLDDTRIIDATSGWFRGEKTDVDSRHLYFGSWKVLQPSEKPLALSEFGGYCLPVEGHLFNPEKAYGYKSCKSRQAYTQAIEKLYRQKLLPAVRRGVCAAIYTQVSDVEDEINGFLTYDRRCCKTEPETMMALAKDLRQALEESVR